MQNVSRMCFEDFAIISVEGFSVYPNAIRVEVDNPQFRNTCRGVTRQFDRAVEFESRVGNLYYEQGIGCLGDGSAISIAAGLEEDEVRIKIIHVRNSQWILHVDESSVSDFLEEMV
jgi:hypothetical protein